MLCNHNAFCLDTAGSYRPWRFACITHPRCLYFRTVRHRIFTDLAFRSLQKQQQHYLVQSKYNCSCNITHITTNNKIINLDFIILYHVFERLIMLSGCGRVLSIKFYLYRGAHLPFPHYSFVMLGMLYVLMLHVYCISFFTRLCAEYGKIIVKKGLV